MKTEFERRVTTRARRVRHIRQRHQSKRILIPKPAAALKPERRFNCQKHGLQAVEDLESGLRRLQSDLSSIVVAVDGACRANGRPDARAGYGVFFSSTAAYLNSHGVVPPSSPQTSQYAELYATMRALDIIHQLIIAGENLSHVIVKTDSAYLEKGLSAYVWKWVVNGFLNVKGQPVVNGRAFKYLHEKVLLLEREYGVQVSFCKVGKEFNQQAVRLARLALS